MQDFVEVKATDIAATGIMQIQENVKTAMSNSSGTAFPTANLYVGMHCYRTDQNKEYVCTAISGNTGTWTLVRDYAYGATQTVSDADGNEIGTTYFKNAGGTVSGNVKVTGSTDLNTLSVNGTTALKSDTTVTGKVTASGGFVGNLTGTADKATADSAGQQINKTYVRNITGADASVTITKGDGTTSSFTVDKVAEAAKATNDGDGNNIKATYLKTVTGEDATVTVTKGDGVSSSFTVNNVAHATTSDTTNQNNGLYFRKSGNYLQVSTDGSTWKPVVNVSGTNYGAWGNCNCNCNCDGD